jgi:hypothetical protein
MKTGDIILCSGTGPLSQLIIKYNRVVMKMTGPAAEISHVAMIGPRDTEVFEATTLNKWCNKKGVQINDFEEWLFYYPGRVWIRESCILGTGESAMDSITSVMRIRMQAEMCKLIGKSYESGIPGALELAFVGLDIPWLSEWWRLHLRTTKYVHCSEVDALLLQAGGVLPATARPNKLPPCLWWDLIPELNYYYDKPEQIK